MDDKIKPRMDGPIARCDRDCPSHGQSTFEQYDPSECAITGRRCPNECGPWYQARIAELEATLATAREDAVREFAEWLDEQDIDDLREWSRSYTVSCKRGIAARFLAETGKDPR
jgi:hypothetical protein